MKIRLAIVVLLVLSNTYGQDNVGVKLFGLSLHPLGERQNAHLMPRKLDPDAYLVLNLGAIASVEKFLYKDAISIKALQAMYADCADRLGGFSHIGVRFKIFKIKRHFLSGGIGPTLVFRRNWQEMPTYENKNRFKGGENQRWQYMFLWYAGEFEYKYSIDNNIDLTTSFVPGYPDLMSLSVGVNYKFKKQKEHFEN